MRGRLSALVRKAGLKESDAAVAPLLSRLSKLLRTKREYEDALGTEEGAEAFAIKLALPEDQERALIAMQVRRG